ncbi:MAG: preprotein translocase subunit SecG [Desulfomicrobium escambiense]|nr:preprotein translocase subunit SecG [Desulfomicrobium escambiense]
MLLQAGKGADIGAVFGGAGGQALFGSAGPADFLNKATRVHGGGLHAHLPDTGFFNLERPTKSIMSSSTVSDPDRSPAPHQQATAHPPATAAPSAPRGSLHSQAAPRLL